MGALNIEGLIGSDLKSRSIKANFTAAYATGLKIGIYEQ